MNELSPKEIALRIAFLISTLSCIFLGITSLILHLKIPFFVYLILFSLTIIAGYAGFLFALEKFIYRKIKLIYKSIHRHKLKKGLSSIALSQNSDLLNQVQQDVIDWAKTNEDEITRLQELETYRREFVGNVSHELKTPIFSIQGYLLTLLEGGLDDPTINKDYLLKANNSVERMINLIEDLDEISKLESGKLSLKIEKINIVELAKEVILMLEDSAKSSKMKINLLDAAKPIWVMADYAKITQVMVNLVVNSIRYSKTGETIQIKFFDMHDTVLVEVADKGEGIEAHHLPRLFERFYRTDKGRARESGGSGLGLSIVKHIIEAHQQTVNVRSTVGIGSTFSFTLAKAKNK